MCWTRPPGGRRCNGHPLLYAMFTWPKEVPPGLGLDGGGSTHGVYTGSSKTRIARMAADRREAIFYFILILF